MDLINSKLNEERNYIVIGDIHGCYTELRLLLVRAGFVINDNNKIVRTNFTKNIDILLLGDYLDRGSEIAATINFLYNNMDNGIYFIIGNHEQVVYNYLVTKLLTDIDSNIYNSIKIFKNDDILLTKFIALYNKSKYYFLYDDIYIITHALCDVNTVKMLDTDNSKYSYAKIFPSKYPSQSKLKFDKNRKVIQIFGHMVIPKPYYDEEYIALDTGCCFGGELSSVIIGKDFSLVKPISVNNVNIKYSLYYKYHDYPILIEETKNFMQNNLFSFQ